MNAIFIHSKLDEWGLPPIPFRVLCHIARRGDCFASAASISRVCKIHKNTVWPTLKFLEDYRFVQATRRPGQTTLYTLNPILTWADPPQNNSRVGRPTHHNQIVGTHHNQIATHPPQNNSHKGYPREGDPKKEIPISKKRGKFSLSMVLGAGRKHGMPEANAEECYFHHEGRGWKGIKNLDAIVQAWMKSPHYKPAANKATKQDHAKGFFQK